MSVACFIGKGNPPVQQRQFRTLELAYDNKVSDSASIRVDAYNTGGTQYHPQVMLI